tara:strand:+ start:237 stop:965 length:729 start_codon:yes stop_codon:yes gene_type:complete
MKNKIIENIKVLFFAILIAIIIRSFLFQPFYIPSSSMEPTLLIGDRIFVTKYSYGYSRHSMPFSPKIFSDRIFDTTPKRGDIIVFKTPADNRTDYIKRLIGMPGDKINIKDGELYINAILVTKKKITESFKIYCGSELIETETYLETLPNGIKYTAVYIKNGTMMNTDIFSVPENHYFFMGDNRDCSKDSRFLSSVGYVNFNNLVGKAQVIFFSSDNTIAPFYKFWKWGKSIRFNRIFYRIR